MLRKSLTLAILMSLAFSVQAQPCPTSGLEIILEGLELKPGGDFLQYASVEPLPPTSGPVSVVNHIVKKVRPGFDTGFGIGVGYLFACSSNDIKAHWQHLNTTDFNSVNASADQIVEIPFVINENFFFTHARGEVDFHYDAVDLDLGHSILFFNCFQARFYTGLRYARLERKFTIFQNDPPLEVLPVESIGVTMDLEARGIGPQIGINTTYYFGCYFGLETDFSVAGIIDNAKSRTQTDAVIRPDGFVVTNVVSPDDQTRVIPAIESRLGLQFRYQFCNGTVFKASAGYQYADYIGAFNEVVLNAGMTGISSIDFRKIDANFQGPYLKLSVKI